MYNLCKKLFPTPLQLARHMYNHQHKNIICDMCQQQFHFHIELKKHKVVHRVNPSHQCIKANCRRWFIREVDLMFHLQPHRKQKWKCDLCKNFSTSCKKYLKDHVKGTHTDVLPYKCLECDQWFKWHQQVHRHKETDHKKQHWIG